MEKLKTALYLAWHRLQGALYSFMQLWKTVLYSIGYRSPRSFKEDLKADQVPRYRLDELELWNCFSYYPSVTSFDILDGQSGKFFGKDKKTGTRVHIFLQLTGHTQRVI